MWFIAEIYRDVDRYRYFHIVKYQISNSVQESHASIQFNVKKKTY